MSGRCSVKVELLVATPCSSRSRATRALARLSDNTRFLLSSLDDRVLSYSALDLGSLGVILRSRPHDGPRITPGLRLDPRAGPS